MTEIYYIGTEWFWDYYDKTSPANKLDSLANWAGTIWEQEVDNSSNDYEITTYVINGSNKIVIPESALPNNDDLSERGQAADDWLVNNTTLNDDADAFIVADHYGFENNYYGWAYVATAGNDNNITAIADLSWEDNGELPPAYSNVKSEGLAFHELCHTFDAQHDDGDTQSDGDASLMWDWNTVDCSQDSPGQLKKAYLSECSTDRIQNYYDNNRTSFSI